MIQLQIRRSCLHILPPTTSLLYSVHYCSHNHIIPTALSLTCKWRLTMANDDVCFMYCNTCFIQQLIHSVIAGLAFLSVIFCLMDSITLIGDHICALLPVKLWVEIKLICWWIHYNINVAISVLTQRQKVWILQYF